MRHQLSTHFFNKKTRIISTSLSLILLVGGLLFALLAFEVQAASAVTLKTVMYVEIGSHDFNNARKYTLVGTNQPAFDTGIIFAANINCDTVNKKPCLYPDERVQQTLDEAETRIRPVQARGTKVLLSILGNHEGAGFANFPTYESTDISAARLEQIVNTYHLDGIDFDDEYAEYGKNGTPQPNNSSFIWLLQALRDRLGNDKLITFYNIGPAAANSSANPQASPLINYAWNPHYSTWNPPQITGMPVSRLGTSTVKVGVSQDLAAQYAKRTKTEQYGIYLVYNLPGKDSSAYVLAATQELYGRKTNYSSTVPTP